MDSVTRENTFARTICSEELYDVYYVRDYRFQFAVLFLTVVIPFIFLMMLIIGIRNINDGFIKTFTKPSRLVASVLTGIIISGTIVTLDAIACYIVTSGNHEYKNFLKGNSLNMYIVFGTLICDILFVLPLLFCLVYITLIYNGKHFFKLCCCDIEGKADLCLKGIIPILIGKKSLDQIKKISDDSNISVMFFFMLISPILCLASHLGYILLAWLTEPSKCTTIFLLCYFLTLYFHFCFGKSYKHFSKWVISFNFLKKSNVNPRDLSVPEPSKGRFFSFDRVEKKHVNTQTFCLLIFLGFIFYFGIIIMIISIVIVLPLSSENLATYLFNLLQLLVVIISTQVGYKLYYDSGIDLKQVLLTFRKVFAEKESNGGNKNLVAIAKDKTDRYCEIDDATGAFAAELTDVIVQKFQTNTTDNDSSPVSSPISVILHY